MIKITQREAEYINKRIPNRYIRLKKASENKRSGGKTYYVLNDDFGALKVLAYLRGYKNKTKRFFRNGKMVERNISPVKQLLADNWWGTNV